MVFIVLPALLYFIFQDRFTYVYCPMCDGHGTYKTYTHSQSKFMRITYETTHKCNMCVHGKVNKAVFPAKKIEADKRWKAYSGIEQNSLKTGAKVEPPPGAKKTVKNLGEDNPLVAMANANRGPMERPSKAKIADDKAEIFPKIEVEDPEKIAEEKKRKAE